MGPPNWIGRSNGAGLFPLLFKQALLPVLLMAAGIPAPGAETASGAYRVRGAVQRVTYDSHEVPHPDPDGPFAFDLLVDGANWQMLLQDSKSGPSGQISCDGTNIFDFIPHPRTGPTNGYSHAFSSAASVWPGTILQFHGPGGPLWWLYCSPNVLLGTEGPCLDFMGLLGPMSTATLFFQNGTGAEAAQGFADRRIFLADPQVKAIPPLCLLHVDKVKSVSGIAIPIQANIHRYSQIRRNPDGTPKDLERWSIQCDSWEAAEPLSSYIPDISTNGPAYMQDFRASKYPATVIGTTNWLPLDATEQMATKERARSQALGMAGGKRRTTIRFLFICGVAALTAIGLLSRRKNHRQKSQPAP
jgi:hypothetical protein